MYFLRLLYTTYVHFPNSISSIYNHTMVFKNILYFMIVHTFIYIVHQHNVFQSGSHTQTTQTLWLPSPVLLSTCKCSQPPLEYFKVLSDTARAFSRTPECTCSGGGAFRILPEMSIMIRKFRSRWDLCRDLQDTSRAAEISAQALWETWYQILTPVVFRIP